MSMPDYPANYIPKYKPEIISYVYDKLYKQGKKSTKWSGCAYRCGEARCAIGWLIPDADYDQEIEGYNLFDLGQFEWITKLPWYSPENMEFLDDIQKSHDQITLHFHNALRERFYRLAMKYGLDVKFLDH